MISSTIEWLRTAVGSDAATVRILLPDADGRLRVIAAHGGRIAGGRLRSSRRRRVFDSKMTEVLSLHEPPGFALALYPLVAGDEAVGVVEVAAPAANLDDRSEIIGAVLDSSANAFRSARQSRAWQDELLAAGMQLRLASELLSADTDMSAVRTTVRLCFDQIGVPIMGLLPSAGSRWRVVAARGLGTAARAELGRWIGDVSAHEARNAARDRLLARFAAAVGGDDHEAFDAGPAMMLVADAPVRSSSFLDAAASLLSEALAHVGPDWIEVREADLDLAIACTAHELKGPLVGAKAALDHVLDVAEEHAAGWDLLRRTRQELDRLSSLVDPLLRWSAGSGSLHRRPSDLVAIVQDAVGSCRLESADASVVVDAPDRVTVDADAEHLRGAIANLVRNALAYSGAGAAEPVKVSVESSEGSARVHIADRGPGVSETESRAIFDPFTRGVAGRAMSGGNGLGLFIARRIVEAHGGSIGVRSEGSGSTFSIDLPAPRGRNAACAS